MKTRTILTSVIASAALLLPAGAFANAGTRASTSSSSAGQDASRIQSSMTPDNLFTQISKDELKNRVTADDIVGKDVVDRHGEKIGKVKEVGLSQVIRNGSQSSGDSYTASGSIAGANASASVGSATSASPGTGNANPSGWTSANGNVNLIVALDDDVKDEQIDKDFAVIPASQVTFDREEDRLELNLVKQQFASNLR